MKLIFKNLILPSFAILTLFFSVSCDKIPSGVISPEQVNYNVVGVNIPSNIFYSPSDSLIITSVQIENFSSVAEVWMSIKSLDGTITLYEKINLFDDGKGDHADLTADDGIYTAVFKVSRTYPNGVYIADFFVRDNIRNESESTKHVAEAKFEYDNNQIQYAPVLSELSLPDSVKRGNSFIFTVKADDQNGLNDIKYVYFKLYRPDGSLVDPGTGSQFFVMNDKGDSGFGDETAGDGIYSFKNSFGETLMTGSWKFEFQAIDWEGNLSNLITQTIQVN